MFKLTIDTDNDAFSDDSWHSEVARILRKVAAKVEDGRPSGAENDGNGNSVCKWEGN